VTRNLLEHNSMLVSSGNPARVLCARCWSFPATCRQIEHPGHGEPTSLQASQPMNLSCEFAGDAS
jgi:hypothetical protein